ncbi:hypothetical protein PIB30_014181 [Stylosanthes scabra]|uniref:F-box domain-containing protein n=1 Tax=Stylosanthes scabra TaxID=79078 RepID=A0ABU6V962_9FABA|nr:hypothetical protein [Stylosanthes scabra]
MDLEKKRKKHCKGRRKGEGKVERRFGICDLPDEILQLIITSLRTKEAIRTSILSKRWQHLWKGISKIELKEGKLKERKQFMHFVTRLLVACNCSGLKKFSLSCNVRKDANLVNEWLCGFINPKIEELSLQFEEIQEPLIFPDQLFTCATLTNFHLDMPYIFKLPSSIHFQCLQTLSLSNIIFPDTSTQQLFSGCPALEDLYLLDCNLKNVQALRICSPLLRRIYIWEIEDDECDIDGLDVSNCCEVLINGNNLKSFHYQGDCVNEYFVYDSSLVIDASIQIHERLEYYLKSDPTWQIAAGNFTFRLLKMLPNVEKLSMSGTSIKALSRTRSLLGQLPLFCNLAELALDLDRYSSIKLSYLALLTLLQNSPCLQVLKFQGGLSLAKDKANCISDPLPVCFSTTLKMIEITGITWKKDELFAIKILLKAGTVLDKLRIQSSCIRSKELYKQILNYPKSSMDCKIEF